MQMTTIARLAALAARPRLLFRAWRGDRRGATLIQFVAVLPVLVLLIFGTWSLYVVYSAHQTLCDATWRASRYLQVEGPMFDPEEITYPDGWRTIATSIINSSLRNNPMVAMQVSDGDVRILPDTNVGGAGHPAPPKEQLEVTGDSVKDAWFFVRATTVVTHPLAFLIPGTDTPGQLKVTCQTMGFYETEPIEPTGKAGGPKPTKVRCQPPPPMCSPGPGPTTCGNPPCPTEDPCKCR